MRRVALLLLALAVRGEEEEEEEEACDSEVAAAERDAEQLADKARTATNLHASSAALYEATAAYKLVVGLPGANRTKIQSKIGLLHSDFYHHLQGMVVKTGMPQDMLLHGHMKQAYSSFQAATRELRGQSGEDWRRLATTQEDLCLANLLEGEHALLSPKPAGKHEWQAVGTSFVQALEHLPHWTRGWARLSTILDEHSVTLPMYVDGLAVLDQAAERFPLADHHEWSQAQRRDLYWMRSTASAMHAERGQTARAISLVDGIGRAKEDDTIDTLSLNGERLLEHYSAPWRAIQEAPDQPPLEQDDSLATAWADVLSPELLDSLQTGFRLSSPYWMVGSTRAGYSGDYYSHWFDLSAEPTNSIHQALHQIASTTLSPEQQEVRHSGRQFGAFNLLSIRIY
jgi:hypothetical protein